MGHGGVMHLVVCRSSVYQRRVMELCHRDVLRSRPRQVVCLIFRLFARVDSAELRFVLTKWNVLCFLKRK
jgi:hypothetical protein